MKTSEQIPEPRTAGSGTVGNNARIPAYHDPNRSPLLTQHAWPVLARSRPNPMCPFAQATAARASGQASPQQVSHPSPHFFAPADEKAKQRCFTEFHQQLFGTPMRTLSSPTTPPTGTAATRSAFTRLEVSHG